MKRRAFAGLLAAAGMAAVIVSLGFGGSAPKHQPTDMARLQAACAASAPALQSDDPDFQIIVNGEPTGIVACSHSGAFDCWIKQPSPSLASGGLLTVYGLDPGCIQ